MKELLAIIIYFSIFFSSLVGSILYIYAYFKMKKSKIIGALSLLLITIFIDNLFWLSMEFYRFINGGYINILIQPLVLAIIKSILAVGLTYFVWISVRTDKKPLKNGIPKNNC